jgi:hypothetical protein
MKCFQFVLWSIFQGVAFDREARMDGRMIVEQVMCVKADCIE